MHQAGVASVSDERVIEGPRTSIAFALQSRLSLNRYPLHLALQSRQLGKNARHPPGIGECHYRPPLPALREAGVGWWGASDLERSIAPVLLPTDWRSQQFMQVRQIVGQKRTSPLRSSDFAF